MSKFKACIIIIFTVVANINISKAQQWSNITNNNIWNLNSGNVGVGTTNAPINKFEIEDGNAGKFTFSAPNCTDGYVVSQTIDDVGYKLNVGSLNRSYIISINGVDKLKILTNENYGVGKNSLDLITTGTSNTALGGSTLPNNTTGYSNSALGGSSLYSNISGYHNSAFGQSALYKNINGYHNIAIGSSALYNSTTGIGNSTLGYASLFANISGSYNSALGYYAGRYIADGLTGNLNSSNSIFIGYNSKAHADNQSNQIVIGYNAIGNGSNTVTLGNDLIAKTLLKGNVGIGTMNPDEMLTVNGKIHAIEVIVDLDILADYVFEPDYNLMPLQKVEQFVRTNKHLPGIPSAAEVKKDGLSMGEMQNKLLQKIEELTLYMIEQGKTINQQSAKIKELEEKLR